MTIGVCNDAPPVLGSVDFDPVFFKQYYPEFDALAPAVLQANFTRATLLLSNCCTSLECDAPTRQILYGLLVAHITALTQGAWGKPPSGVVGRVSQATEGSVSATIELTGVTTSTLRAYLQQTQYGLEYLASVASLTQARYVAPYCAEGYGGWNQWDAWPQ